MIAFNTVMEFIIDNLKTALKDRGYTESLKVYDSIGVAFADRKEDNSDLIMSNVYGIYRNQTSQISTVSDGLNMLTGTAVIDFLIDALEDDDGTFPRVNNFVRIINDCAGEITGRYAALTEGGVSYAILPVMSPATVGAYQEESSNFGAYVPVSVQVAFTALEGAVTPDAVKLWIDNDQIPLTEMVVSRSKSATSDVPANSYSGATANSDDSSTLEVQFSCPVIKGTTDAITDELYSGKTNVPHVAVIKDRTKSVVNKCYLVELAKIQQTKQPNATIGLNVNLLEMNPETVDFPDDGSWKHVTVSVKSDTMKATVNIDRGVWCVFWGDGTSNVINANSGSITMSRPYKHAGTYQVHMYRWMGDVT